MIRALAVAALLALQGVGPNDTAARVCRLPSQRLDSQRDTAAWCAREFLMRNGYTAWPSSANATDIALEPVMDVGKGLDNVLANRRNTVSEQPELSCTTHTGFLVSFTMPNQVDQKYGKGVVMTSQYVGITLLAPWVLRGSAPTGKCSAPHLPAP